MKAMRLALLLGIVGVLASLAGCLEVEQHPPWHAGYYDGKPDPLPDEARFHGDRLAWMAALINRNHLQDEYVRMRR
jgi:hypothetical protein